MKTKNTTKAKTAKQAKTTAAEELSLPRIRAQEARPALSGGTITVPLTLPVELYAEIMAMGEYDERSCFSETIAHSMDGDVAAWLESPDQRGPIRCLKRWLKTHPPDQLPTKQRVPLLPLLEPGEVDVVVRLPEAAYLLLRAVSERETAGSVIEFVRGVLANEIRRLALAWSDDGNPALFDLFGVGKEAA